MSDAVHRPATGRLLVCATPIGNLGDVTLRVLDALRSADAIAAEDTRVTRKLLSRYEIGTRLERCDEHTVERQAPVLVRRMLGGETIAFVSDAGTPGVSDPGARLIAAAVDAGVPVEALPGASAVLTALVASGLPMQRFYFGGFLPRKASRMMRSPSTKMAIGSLTLMPSVLPKLHRDDDAAEVVNSSDDSCVVHLCSPFSSLASAPPNRGTVRISREAHCLDLTFQSLPSVTES
jgi:hypothetical protein